jgi:hypothetical protein
MAPEIRQLEAAILNAAWMVRHYADRRNESRRLHRSQALLQLGLTVRHAFTVSDDFEPLLVALVDGLRPKDDPTF